MANTLLQWTVLIEGANYVVQMHYTDTESVNKVLVRHVVSAGSTKTNLNQAKTAIQNLIDGVEGQVLP